MISSVGMFGFERGYAPLAAFYRVPLLVLVGQVTPRPVAVAGNVVVRPVLPLTATLDRRYVDVAQASRLAAAIRAYCHEPAAHEPHDIVVERPTGHVASTAPAGTVQPLRP